LKNLSKNPTLQQDFDTILSYSFARLDLPEFMQNFRKQREDFLSSLNQQAHYVSDHTTPPQIITKAIPFSVDQKELPEAPFHTKEVLSFGLREIQSLGKVQENTVRFILVLQKKFEVFHRLCKTYGSSFKVADTQMDDPGTYALFSLLLSFIFHQTSNFNYLNSAIKANDLLVMAPWNLNKKEVALVSLALQIEGQLLYGSN
jgi:hypothetical protein